MNSGLRSGESDILRVASIWVLRGRLAYEAELGASNPSYDGSAAHAVTGITFVGDGIGKANGRLTVETRPLHVLRGVECNATPRQGFPVGCLLG